MLLHTQTSSKRAFKDHLKPKKHSATTHSPPIQESEDMDAMDPEEIEYEKNMWAARYTAIVEMMLVVFMILALIIKYCFHGHVQSIFVEFVLINSISLIMSAIYLWRLTREFFSELSSNKAVRK